MISPFCEVGDHETFLDSPLHFYRKSKLDSGCRSTAEMSAAAGGKPIRKTDPRPMWDSTVRRPLCASMIDRQIDKPMPIPWAFVVKKGSKMRPAVFSSSPGPESSTEIRTPDFPFFSDFTRR